MIGGAGQHGVANLLCFQGVAETRMHRFAGLERLQEIGDLVNERVFVADVQSRHPPIAHVGLIAVADVNAPANRERCESSL